MAVKLLNKLRGVKNYQNGWMAYCPSHDDGKERALSVSERDGKLLVKCFAGCPADKILAAADMGLGDLFEEPLAPRAEARTVSRFTLPDGSVAEHKRLDLPEGKRMWWERNSKKGLDGYPVASLPLYGDIAQEPVIVVEGEKARDAIASRALALTYDVVATVCGSSTIPCDESLSALLGHYVALWPDNDDPGRQHMTRIAYWLANHGEWPFIVSQLTLPPKGDAADFTGDLGELLRDAAPWNEGVMPNSTPLAPDAPRPVKAARLL